jgi:hypothetical protein
VPAKFANRTVDERSDKYAGLTETTDGFKFLFAFARIPCKLVGAKRKSRLDGAAGMNGVATRQSSKRQCYCLHIPKPND